MSFLKMFRDWAGGDNEEKQRFTQAWASDNPGINHGNSCREYHIETAWQIYLLQKEVELLRMKQQ